MFCCGIICMIYYFIVYQGAVSAEYRLISNDRVLRDAVTEALRSEAEQNNGYLPADTSGNIFIQ